MQQSMGARHISRAARRLHGSVQPLGGLSTGSVQVWGVGQQRAAAPCSGCAQAGEASSYCRCDDVHECHTVTVGLAWAVYV
jgi:hypothetical protein